MQAAPAGRVVVIVTLNRVSLRSTRVSSMVVQPSGRLPRAIAWTWTGKDSSRRISTLSTWASPLMVSPPLPAVGAGVSPVGVPGVGVVPPGLFPLAGMVQPTANTTKKAASKIKIRLDLVNMQMLPINR